jgi:t-SNARE complex subunit (syntaxin)
VGKLQTLGKQLSDKQAQYVARHSQDEDKQEHQLITSGNVSARIEYIQADVDLEAVEDQREALRDIEQSVRQLGDMMKDISLLVEEQQEAVDTLEHNIQSTTNSVQEGSEQIGLAAQHQKSSRKWMCWLLLILLITALVLVLVFVLKQ